MWADANHDRDIMRKIGRFKVERIEDFLLIQELKVGGSIQISSQGDSVITMDNGMMLKEMHFPEDVFKIFKDKQVNYS